MADQQTGVVKFKNISEKVLARVNELQTTRGLLLPDNYAAGNALISAQLILNGTLDRNKKPVLEACTEASVAQALMDMVIQGLSPAKKQCYFIAYGTQLTMIRSYHGAKAVCMRANPEIKDIRAQVIYEGDQFEETITNGLRAFKHKSEFGNIDDNKIKGAYAVAVDHSDNVIYAEAMTFDQIKQNWKKSKVAPVLAGGKLKADTTHAEFPGEMSKRTVVNRLAKLILNVSDDSDLVLHESVRRTDEAEFSTSDAIEAEANTAEVVDFEEEVTAVDADAPAADEETGEIKQPEPAPIKQKKTAPKAEKSEAADPTPAGGQTKAPF